MKNFSVLNTDFYQITMCFAYMFADIENEETVFESFTRAVNPKVTLRPYYISDGKLEVEKFIARVREELTDPDLMHTFKNLIMPRVKPDHQGFFSGIITRKFPKLRTDFRLNLTPDGSPVYPYQPILQYIGPRWLGQLIETPILNILNGCVSRKSNGEEEYNINEYAEAVKKRAAEYRNSAPGKYLIEAGFRRASNFGTAIVAASEAIKANWNGTGTVPAASFGLVPIESVGGTMAHSYILSFDDEVAAFRVWNGIYPKNTILICTYDVLGCADMIGRENIQARAVRIDTEPLEDYCIHTRRTLDFHGLQEIGICISGDLTPERLAEFCYKNIPFSSAVIGNKYVNPPGFDTQEAGFVYKLVQFEREGLVVQPAKTSKNKTNKPGMKSVKYSEKDNKIVVSFSSEGGIYLPDRLTTIPEFEME